MHIANITEEGRGGGPLFGMRTSTVELNKLGVKNTIILPKRFSEKFRLQLLESDISYEAILLSHLTKYLPHLLRYVVLFIPEIIILFMHLRKHKYDLLLCNGSYQIKGVIAAKLAGIPTIWHMNDSQLSSAVHWLYKLISPLASAFMFASTKSKTYYSSLKPSILTKPNAVIQSPINIDKFQSVESGKTELSKSPGLNIITVSYLNANKNVELIIRALEKLQHQINQEANLYIVGPIVDSQKAYKEHLDHIIQEMKIENVHFLGYRSDIPALLSDADVYVCSSNFESSPIAVWEAMVNGTMVVTTDVGDVRTIIEENNAGIVIETGNLDQLVDALVIATNQTQNISYQEKGKKVALEYFDASKIALEIKEFAESIAKKPISS
jgi:glycosyltransferase involved in cell wall biosynthesis